MSQETKSALLIGFIFIMIVLVVVVDGIDAGRAPAAEDAISGEVQKPKMSWCAKGYKYVYARMRSFILPPKSAHTGRSLDLPKMSQHAISKPENAPITVRSGLCVKPEE